MAVAAVLLRCAIAPGFMLDPVAVAQGQLKLVICTSAGAKSMPVTPGKERSPNQQGDVELCPYAGSSHAAAPVDLVILGGERLSLPFEMRPRDAGPQPARIRSFAARAPPIFS
jgi:hypothetical protein